jgi:hypothetical protein
MFAEEPPSSSDPTKRSCRTSSSARTRQRFPRSNRPAEYRQAREVASLFSSWMPQSGHLDAHLRISRFHSRPRPSSEPGRTALLRPLPRPCADPLSAAGLGGDQTDCGGGAEAEHRRSAGACRRCARCRPWLRSSGRTDGASAAAPWSCRASTSRSPHSTCRSWIRLSTTHRSRILTP